MTSPAAPNRLARLRSVAIVAVGVGLALVAGWLGLWQMQVFESQGASSAAARAALPALELDSLVGDAVRASYGRTVVVRGTYVPGFGAKIVGDDGVVRLLATLRLADGRHVPVVRGVLPSGSSVPALPGGTVTQTGLLLPSEPAAGPAPGGDLGSVSLPQLVQTWPTPMVDGFVTLQEADSKAQGLLAAKAELPSGTGSARNAGYALQWWIFGAFALVMSVFIAGGGSGALKRRINPGPDLSE